MLLPWAIPSYISVLIWRGIFQPDGLLNDLLGTDLNHSQTQPSANRCYFGQYMARCAVYDDVIIWCIQSIPREMYEAAEVDGVSDRDQFRHLTLPI